MPEFDSFSTDALWFGLDRVGKVAACFSAGGLVPSAYDADEQQVLFRHFAQMPDLGLPIPVGDQALSGFLFASYTQGATLASFNLEFTTWAKKGMFVYDGTTPGSDAYAGLYWPEVTLKSVMLPLPLVSILERYRYNGIFGSAKSIEINGFVGGASDL